MKGQRLRAHSTRGCSGSFCDATVARAETMQG